jgi:hypothetical protein
MNRCFSTTYCDPNFVKKFLSGDFDALGTVLKRCQDDPAYRRFPNNSTSEKQLYQYVFNTLNIIKMAADQAQSKDRPTTLVLDSSAEQIPSDDPNLSRIKPKLALFEGAVRHWETVGVPIEVMGLTTHLKMGMKLLSRCALAVFSHQLHRRHLYGLVVCGHEATFVRFDRAGILYSRLLDLRIQLEEFTQAFASLLMLDREAFGYDTTFSTRVNQDGRLEYFVDLPEYAFNILSKEKTAAVSGPSSQLGEALGPPTRRLKVMERLCHRKGILGRATTVLCLREVLPLLASPEQVREGTKTLIQAKKKLDPQSQKVEKIGTRDYVLKLAWRNPKHRSEGDALKRVAGVYGLAQWMWHSDVFKVCRCPGSTKELCQECVDKTPDRDGVLVCKNFTDFDIEVPEDGAGEKETEYCRFSYMVLPGSSRVYTHCVQVRQTLPSIPRYMRDQRSASTPRF